MADEPIRTLIVEDEPGDRVLLETLVRAQGPFAVETVPDGEGALDAFHASRHELVLLDLHLPGIDGLEVCRRIRATSSGERTVILFTTGSARTEVVEEALEAGGSDYLVKPIEPESLRVRLTIAERQIHQARDQRRIEAELVRDALHDPLTGLASRSLLEDRLEQAAQRAARDPEYIYGVLDLNLDRYHEINRIHGEGAGDRILKEVAARLRECVRGTDAVARLAGDRFAVFLDGLHELSDSARVVNRIQGSLDTPFPVGGGEIRLTAGIGVALSRPGDESAGSASAASGDPRSILRDAHQALLRAKARGPGSYQMFDPVVQARARARMQMEDRIRSALDRDELELWYQPLVEVDSGRILGFEALARMRDPERGLIPPSEFIPVAEESGLIVDIGWRTLEKGTERIQRWQERFPADPPLTIAINLSTKQFARPEVYGEIRTRVEASGVDPSTLHLEITETALMTDAEAAVGVLQKLKEMEIGLHIDDFGTGYSSLSYLCRLPIDTLKIDRSFISTMTEGSENLEVVRTIVRLAHSLSLDLVAEGVETEEQLELLRELRCRVAQGYLLHRPMEGERVEELLAERALA